jgi:hypothetical protein
MGFGGSKFKYKPGDIVEVGGKGVWTYYYVLGTNDFNPQIKSYPDYMMAAFGLIDGAYKWDSRFKGYHTKAFAKNRGIVGKWYEGVDYLWKVNKIESLDDLRKYSLLAQKGFNAMMSDIQDELPIYEQQYRRSQIKYIFK